MNSLFNVINDTLSILIKGNYLVCAPSLSPCLEPQFGHLNVNRLQLKIVYYNSSDHAFFGRTISPSTLSAYFIRFSNAKGKTNIHAPQHKSKRLLKNLLLPLYYSVFCVSFIYFSSFVRVSPHNPHVCFKSKYLLSDTALKRDLSYVHQ